MFTLIELLVVVAIISILASMLLPVLGRSRIQARRTAGAANMRQVMIGLLMYADDQNDRLPPKATPAWPSFPHHYNGTNNDLRPPVREYNTMPATAYPPVDSPAWDHPSVPPAATMMSWFYWPEQPGLGATAPKLIVGHNRPGAVILQDQLFWESSYGYVTNHLRAGGGNCLIQAGHPACRFYQTYAADDIPGAYGAAVDGAIVWVKPDAFIKSANLGWNWYAYYLGE